jgi:hypothetical protein
MYGVRVLQITRRMFIVPREVARRVYWRNLGNKDYEDEEEEEIPINQTSFSGQETKDYEDEEEDEIPIIITPPPQPVHFNLIDADFQGMRTWIRDYFELYNNMEIEPEELLDFWMETENEDEEEDIQPDEMERRDRIFRSTVARMIQIGELQEIDGFISFVE